jgi:predicted P-loop ATPase/GTPase
MAHQALSNGRLYGKDITKLQEQSTIKTTTELVNPIHRLWNEPAILDSLTSIPAFIMDRFTICINNSSENHLMINKLLMNQISDDFQQKLKEKNYVLHSVDSIQSMNTVIQKFYNHAIETCYDHISTRCDTIIIESYSDNALLPWNTISGFDAVFGIKPREIHKYDPDKYVKAVQLSKPVSAWETSTKKLSDLLKPIEVFHQKPTLSKDIMNQLKQQIPKMIDES